MARRIQAALPRRLSTSARPFFLCRLVHPAVADFAEALPSGRAKVVGWEYGGPTIWAERLVGELAERLVGGLCGRTTRPPNTMAPAAGNDHADQPPNALHADLPPHPGQLRHRNTPGRIRTCDHWFRKPALYPLSYWGLNGYLIRVCVACVLAFYLALDARSDARYT